MATSKVGLIYPFDDFIVISEKPTEINMSNGVLHKDGGASIKYADGFSIYSLHGIKVPEEISMTKIQDMDKQFLDTYYFKGNNAEIRREIIRKIGFELFSQRVGAESIDKKGDYELLLIDLYGQTGKIPFLKMKNPSIDTWHVEAVDRECKTVEQALNFRKPPKLKSIPVSENGSDWYQQGDVCVWPKEAKYLKPYPTILT